VSSATNVINAFDVRKAKEVTDVANAVFPVEQTYVAIVDKK
jgi:hypothetical protein